MEFLTVTEVKQILEITDTTHDDFIETIKPLVENQFFLETNNYFEKLVNDVNVESDGISFVNGSPDTIVDSNSGFVTGGFVAGMDIRIKGSARNDSIVRIASLVAGTITLETNLEVVSEAFGLDVALTMVALPKQLKMVFSKIIEYYIPTDQTRDGVKSEKFDTYSVSFGENGIGTFPQAVRSLIMPYMKVRWD